MGNLINYATVSDDGLCVPLSGNVFLTDPRKCQLKLLTTDRRRFLSSSGGHCRDNDGLSPRDSRSQCLRPSSVVSKSPLAELI